MNGKSSSSQDEEGSTGRTDRDVVRPGDQRHVWTLAPRLPETQGHARTNDWRETAVVILVPPELQRKMAASLDAEIVEIATGHGPFREQPQRLAELLVDTAR